MQNSRHIKELKKTLYHFGNVPFYSVVLFYGDCVLKDVSFIPKGTFLAKSKRVRDVMKIILKENDPVNIEVDLMARYLHRMLQSKEKETKFEFLKERGFI